MKKERKTKYEKDFIHRFWTKVKRMGDEECWEWIGAISSKGYGSFSVGKGKIESAHRVVYEITYGEIPVGMHVLHKCDNRKCVNPKHIFLGTNKDNVADMVIKGRQAKGEKNGRSILTYKKVEEIRKVHSEEKNTYKEIALRFGVSYSTIRKVVKEEYWKLPLAE